MEISGDISDLHCFWGVNDAFTVSYLLVELREWRLALVVCAGGAGGDL